MQSKLRMLIHIQRRLHTLVVRGQNIRDWHTPMKSDFLSYNTSYKKTDQNVTKFLFLSSCSDTKSQVFELGGGGQLPPCPPVEPPLIQQHTMPSNYRLGEFHCSKYQENTIMEFVLGRERKESEMVKRKRKTLWKNCEQNILLCSCNLRSAFLLSSLAVIRECPFLLSSLAVIRECPFLLSSLAVIRECPFLLSSLQL